jgi:hypothetical protein
VNVKPSVPETANDIYGRRCPLCRNSVSVPIYRPDKIEIERFRIINLHVNTEQNTITRHRLEKYGGLEDRLDEESGACSTSAGGFRPWRLDNGTKTLGY